MNEVPAQTIKRIQSLTQMAAELTEGKRFDITRLTVLKGLSKDPDAAAAFALYLAKKTSRPSRSGNGPAVGHHNRSNGISV